MAASANNTVNLAHEESMDNECGLCYEDYSDEHPPVALDNCLMSMSTAISVRNAAPPMLQQWNTVAAALAVTAAVVAPCQNSVRPTTARVVPIQQLLQLLAVRPVPMLPLMQQFDQFLHKVLKLSPLNPNLPPCLPMRF
jgi:hypothetical protein